LFVDGVWTEDAGGPSPIGGVARSRSLSLVGARCRSVSLAASALDDLSPLSTLAASALDDLSPLSTLALLSVHLGRGGGTRRADSDRTWEPSC
jgi:hypothetical protein